MMADAATKERGSPAFPPSLQRKLAGAWRKEQAFVFTSGMSVLLAWIGGLALGALVIDRFLDLPGYGRVLLLVMCVAASVAAAWKHSRWLRRHDPVRTALRVEDRHRELNSVLVSAVEFSRTPLDPGTSESLRRNVVSRAAADTLAVPFGDFVRTEGLKKGLAALGAVAVLYVGLTALKSSLMHAFVVRMLNPFAEAAYPTRTRLELQTGDAVVKEGDSVTLAARAGGHVPERGTVHIKAGEARAVSVDLERGPRQSESTPSRTMRLPISRAASSTRAAAAARPSFESASPSAASRSADAAPLTGPRSTSRIRSLSASYPASAFSSRRPFERTSSESASRAATRRSSLLLDERLPRRLQQGLLRELPADERAGARAPAERPHLVRGHALLPVGRAQQPKGRQAPPRDVGEVVLLREDLDATRFRSGYVRAVLPRIGVGDLRRVRDDVSFLQRRNQLLEVLLHCCVERSGSVFRIEREGPLLPLVDDVLESRGGDAVVVPRSKVDGQALAQRGLLVLLRVEERHARLPVGRHLDEVAAALDARMPEVIGGVR
ncbi:MAG: hypothetical protein ACYTKD_25025 [Planctomycetota bacterium]|jgi:hypothetical protein